MKKYRSMVLLAAGLFFALSASAQAGDSGIWKPADNSNSFYIQTYDTGSCVVIVSPDGLDFNVFLEEKCEDKVNALELFGRLATLDLTFTSDATATADLVINSRNTQYALNRIFEGDCRGQDQAKGTLTNSLGMTFAYIPPGRFTMGSPESESGRGQDESRHLITLTRGFYMQTTEVTQDQWVAVMGSNPSSIDKCENDCPVQNVSWDDVQDFIAKLNAMGEGTYRLPTEAEWEYAARATSDLAFADGDIGDIKGGECTPDPNLETMGWYCDNSESTSHPVAQKNPNAWGLYDMHGNVWEWVQDWYGEYPSGPVTDPSGPSTGSFRVFRGGAWVLGATSCRSAARGENMPASAFYFVGARLAMVAP